MNSGRTSVGRIAARLGAVAAFGAAVGLFAAPAAAQLRVGEYNIATLQGNTTAFQSVLTAMHADDKPGFAVPVSVFIFQEVHGDDVATLTTLINNAAPAGVSYTLATYTTSVPEDGSAGAQAMFYRTGMFTEVTAAHQDIPTGAGRNTDRWKLQLTGYATGTGAFYIYSSHLKASQGFEAERLAGAQAIRNNADSLPRGTHLIMGGDMNMYTNAEPAYAEFISAGNGQGVDELGNGSWAGAANAIKHSQSPLFTPVNGLVGGGMNDRFDIQFSSNAFNDGLGLSYMAGTYRSLGNDGMHYNLAINNGNNFYYPGQLARSNTLASNLAAASDHVPLLVDYQLPALMAGTITPDYGRVIQGAAFNVGINVTNPAACVVASGADLLDYTADGSLGLSGSAADSVAPLGDVSSPVFALDTSAVGVRTGKVTLFAESEATLPATLQLNTTGTIVRHANGSFSGSSDVDALNLPLAFDANTGVQQFTVNIHNYGFDAMQALLDVDSVSAVFSPFGYVGGAATGIGASPDVLTFSFDTTGLGPGSYNAPVTIGLSDENLPGAATSTLALQVSVTINGSKPCAADVTADGIVNIDDLLAVINAWGACPEPRNCAADTNDDGLVNIDDLLTVINGWGLCP